MISPSIRLQFCRLIWILYIWFHQFDCTSLSTRTLACIIIFKTDSPGHFSPESTREFVEFSIEPERNSLLITYRRARNIAPATSTNQLVYFIKTINIKHDLTPHPSGTPPPPPPSNPTPNFHTTEITSICHRSFNSPEISTIKVHWSHVFNDHIYLSYYRNKNVRKIRFFSYAPRQSEYVCTCNWQNKVISSFSTQTRAH